MAVKTVSYKVLTDEMEQMLASKPATETAEQAADDLLRKADNRTSTESTSSAASSSTRPCRT